ncbi:hypothetical protein OB13_15015 [Pontibacter sp. HJ8]
MPKHIHIPINGIIGEYEDDYGFTMPGFTEQHIDWYTGYDVNGNWTFNQEIEQITLHINSPGGDVHEGFAIYNKLLRIKEQGIVVEVQVDSLCASIATVIALAASPGKLKMREASIWMTHKPMIPQLHYANSDELRATATALDSYEQPILSLYARKTGKEVAEIKELLKTDSYMNAEEAKAYGWIDEVLAGALPEAIQTEKEGKVKAVAFYNPKRNPIPINKMAITKEEKADIVSDVVEGIKAFFGKGTKPQASAKPAPKATAKPKPKAEAETVEVVAATTDTADGATIYHEGELEAGTAVFADVEMTEALEDGLYDLNDGREIEVVEGTVANITEAEEEEEEAEASASAKKPTPKAKAAASDTKALAAKVKALEAKLSQVVPGSGNETPKPNQAFTNNDPKGKAHPLDSVAVKIRTK